MPIDKPATVRPADSSDVEAVSSILQEAAQWLMDRGVPLWKTGELQPEHVKAEVCRGMYWLALVAGDLAGCVRFQLEDPLFWPDVPSGESAFVHRLAVRRCYSGGAVSGSLLDWACGHARQLERRWLRLDTAADRPALRGVYQRYGFLFHSERQVGPYRIARYQIDLSRSMRSDD